MTKREKLAAADAKFLRGEKIRDAATSMRDLREGRRLMDEAVDERRAALSPRLGSRGPL